MTASREQDQAAGRAQAAGERFAQKRATVSEQQAKNTSGCDVEVSQTGWSGPAPVDWPKRQEGRAAGRVQGRPATER